MRSITIGTAGHVDHGKTALVKALTGIDADRLAEEKRRGITIDLGFAHTELPDRDGGILRLAFVDVPGHERFVRNMLAGVGGIDLVLLVIAADESIKPQTREHLDIVQLLGVQRGITVLTKSDAVDAETLDVARLEVEEFLRGTFLQSSRVVAVSSVTGAGLEELKHAIVEAAANLKKRNDRGLARLPIDRVFTMKGFGTVVTGTLISGTIRVEDELEVFPSRHRVRVRGMQVHGQSNDAVGAGQRAALNLAGASTEELARGMTLVPPATFEGTRQADVLLHLLPSAPRVLKQRARVHFHSNTMETTAEVVLHGEVESTSGSSRFKLKERLAGESGALHMSPGQQWLARIRLAGAALLLPGDRFIIRQFSPVVTIGGGTVMDAAPIPGLKGRSRLEALNALITNSADEAIRSRIARRSWHGISLPQLVSETGMTVGQLEIVLSPLIANGVIVRGANCLLHSESLSKLSTAVTDAVSSFHQSDPLAPGIGKGALREKVHASAEVLDLVLGSLARGKKVELAAELVRLPGRGLEMKDEESESKKKIEAAFSSAGLKVPPLPEVIAGLKIDKTRAQKIVTLMLREKILIKVSDDLVFHGEALDQLRRKILAYRETSARIDVAKFKDLTGVSRKYAIPLLEYLDRERVTRRVGDSRDIL